MLVSWVVYLRSSTVLSSQLASKPLQGREPCAGWNLPEASCSGQSSPTLPSPVCIIPPISQYVPNSLPHNASPVAGCLLAESCSQTHLTPQPLFLLAFLSIPFCFSCPICLYNCDCPSGAATQFINPTSCEERCLFEPCIFFYNSIPTEIHRPYDGLLYLLVDASVHLQTTIPLLSLAASP